MKLNGMAGETSRCSSSSRWLLMILTLLLTLLCVIFNKGALWKILSTISFTKPWQPFPATWAMIFSVHDLIRDSLIWLLLWSKFRYSSLLLEPFLRCGCSFQINAWWQGSFRLLCKRNEAMGMWQSKFWGCTTSSESNKYLFKIFYVCKCWVLIFWCHFLGLNQKAAGRHQKICSNTKKYIHQLSTPYPISGTLFGFKIRWPESKLRDKVLGPKRGP